MNDVTKIWERYQNGVENHQRDNLYSKCQQFHNFYIGNQWENAQTGGETLPVLNFIKPIGKYKISMIAQHKMSINYTGMSVNKIDDTENNICELLNKYATQLWELNKMDSKMWRVIKNAFITGDHYIYFFDNRQAEDSVVIDKQPDIKSRLINKTNIYLSDEQNSNLNEQQYIIVSERLSVERVREMAKQNGIADSDILQITSDEDTSTQIGEDINNEVKSDLGKCTSLLCMRKTDEGIAFSRSVKRVVYQPEQVINRLDTYPIVNFIWEERVGSARGVGGVEYILPNQIEVNRTIARRAVCVKRFAYPTLVYDESMISNVDDLDLIGSNIAIRNMKDHAINEIVQYINPAPISSDAERLQNEIVIQTRELDGAGDAATGQVDPTKASGEAIKAARDQAAVPLNEQIASYKQLIEDIAYLWYKMIVAYSPQGLQLDVDNENGEKVSTFIDEQTLQSLDLSIKIDVSPVDPYSKIAQEISLERLFMSPLVKDTMLLDEYVNALDDTSTVPKQKLLSIVQERKRREQEQAMIAQQMAMEQQILQEPEQGQVPTQPQMQEPLQEDMAQNNQTRIEELLQELDYAVAQLEVTQNDTGATAELQGVISAITAELQALGVNVDEL